MAFHDGIFANYIDFDTAFTATMQEARMAWDGDAGTLQIGMPGGNVNLQVGQEHIIRCRNETGSTITNGSLVYVTGASGNKPTIALADADAEATADSTIGMATEDIANNSNGYVCERGIVRDLNTLAYAEGTKLYLSQTAGAFTDTAPASPAHSVTIGIVTKQHATQGEILLNIHVGSDLASLHDLNFTSLANNDIIKYDSGNGYWINSNTASLSTVTISSFTAGSVVFAGTGGLLSQDNSKFFWDNTNKYLGLGTATPVSKIQAVGEGTTDTSFYFDHYRTASGTYPGLVLRKSRGTVASPTATLNGDGMGSVSFYAYDGTSFLTGASIISSISGTVATNQLYGRIAFYTNNGSTSALERISISPEGYLGIALGTGQNATVPLAVNGVIQGKTTALIGYDAGSTGGLFFTSSTYATPNLPAIQGVTSAFAGADVLINPAGGNIGLGVSSAPAYAVHVNGKIGTNNSILIGNGQSFEDAQLQLNGVTLKSTAGDAYAVISYGKIAHSAVGTNYATAHYLDLTTNTTAGVTIARSTNLYCVNPRETGSGATTHARTIRAFTPSHATSSNVAIMTDNLVVGANYDLTSPPSNGALIEGDITTGSDINMYLTFGINFNSSSSTDHGVYSLHSINSGSYPIRLSMDADSGTQRSFEVGYYASNNPASTWYPALSVWTYLRKIQIAGGCYIADGGVNDIFLQDSSGNAFMRLLDNGTDAWIQSYANDRLVLSSTAGGVLTGLFNYAQKIVNYSATSTLPTEMSWVNGAYDSTQYNSIGTGNSSYQYTFYMAQNATQSGANWLGITNGFSGTARKFQILDTSSNSFIWSTATGVTASGVITWTDIMKLDSSANLIVTNSARIGSTLGVGTTSTVGNLNVVSDSSAGCLGYIDNHYTGSSNKAILGLRRSRGSLSAQTTLATSDIIGEQAWYGYDGSSYIQGAGIQAIVTGTVATNQLGTELRFSVNTDTSFTQTYMTLGKSGGLQMGAPTGGDKGSGTINVATAIYLNNTAYTNPDYVFELEFTGEIQKYINNPGAKDYKGRLTLDELEKFVKENHRFPIIKDKPTDIFERGDMSLILHEETALYLFELKKEIRELKNEINRLKYA